MLANDSIIKPKHIDISKQPWNTYGSSERETTACWIVQFCQDRGNWDSFTWAEINEFYRSKSHGGRFNMYDISDVGKTGGTYGIKHDESKEEGSDDNPYQIYVKFAAIYYGSCPKES